jgi:cellulose synthase/poly-beta-1,6-N-acetylglucosamine synthase-like glycosyltransferase
MAVRWFLAAVFLSFYILFLYPILLWVRSRLRSGKPVRKSPSFCTTVTVVLPVRNGEAWLAAKLDSLLALDYPRGLLDAILVISDGSTDGTDEIARAYGEKTAIVRLLRLEPGGKALALNAAFAQARGEILFLTDVRQPMDRACLRELVACFADPAVGAVSGELIIRDGESSEMANTGLYWRYEKWIRKQLSGIDSILGATGAVYAIRRELVVELPAGTLLDDVHLPLAAFFRGYRVVMDETAKAYDIPTSLDTEFRRKVRTLAGNYQLMGRFPELFSPWRNRMWIHFLSHKFGRLLLPFALVVIAASSLALPAPWCWWMLAGQLAFYGAALIDPLVPERTVLKKITSPIRTFCVLMAATMSAASILVFPQRAFWK